MVRNRVLASPKFNQMKYNELGYIHVLDAPLFPPPSALNTLLLFPQPYSTVTSSAFQVLARMHREHEHSYFTSLIDDYTQEIVEKGRPKVYTAFPPTNKAFGKLGVKANIFLHSPLGIKILKKILAYHVVPHVIFHSDYIYNASSDFIVQPTSKHVDIDASSPLVKDLLEACVDKGSCILPIHATYAQKGWLDKLRRLLPTHTSAFPPLPTTTNSPHPPKHKVNVTDRLPTLLHGHDLQVFVVSWRGLLGRGPIQRSMFVVGAEKEKEDWVELDEPRPPKPGKPKKPKHGKKKAQAAPIIFGDAVARAGAIQTLPRVLIPPFHQHRDGSDDEQAYHIFEAMMDEF